MVNSEITEDIVAELGNVFLGARLKRLGERFQTGALQILENLGFSVQPGHIPLLAALGRSTCPASVGELASMVGSSQSGVTRALSQLKHFGLVMEVEPHMKRVHKRKGLVLTEEGKDVVARMQFTIWPRVDQAVKDICGDGDGINAKMFLDLISKVELGLSDGNLNYRFNKLDPPKPVIKEYSNELSQIFREINLEWIESMFGVESADLKALDDPERNIIDTGGVILFAEIPGLGVVGTCALIKSSGGTYELAKMAVRSSARGLKVGEYLLEAMLERAKTMKVDSLYLLSNKKCGAAVHLYEKVGFIHDKDLLRQYGSYYERCDVAMRYPMESREIN